MMSLRVGAVLFALVALLGTHWKAYVSGGKAVEARYQAQVLAAEQKARELEKTLVVEKQKAEERYVEHKRQAAVTAAGARAELGRLRSALASRREASANPATVAGTNGRTGLEQELFGQCASALVSMAAEADRLETWVVGLQGYVKGVCLPR
jgi:Fe-S cluster assembly scaffold protein SufB